MHANCTSMNFFLLVRSYFVLHILEFFLTVSWFTRVFAKNHIFRNLLLKKQKVNLFVSHFCAFILDKGQVLYNKASQ